MTEPSTPEPSRQRAMRASAFRALRRSIFINVVCSYLVYRLAEPHFSTGSLAPLALSALPPLLGLAYGLIRQRAVDFIGFFAAEDIAVSLLSLALTHTETSALIGRSLQNAILGVIFLGSLVLNKPLVLYLARQLFTGNDPQAGECFDLLAAEPDTMQIYRTLTLVWAVVLFVKSAGSILLALTVKPRNYLILAPIWTYSSDALLVWWSMRYGYAKLRHRAGQAELLSVEPTLPAIDSTP